MIDTKVLCKCASSEDLPTMTPRRFVDSSPWPLKSDKRNRYGLGFSDGRKPASCTLCPMGLFKDLAHVVFASVDFAVMLFTITLIDRLWLFSVSVYVS